MSDPGVSVRIFRPSLVLQPYVTFFYFVECAGALSDFLYPEWGNVRFAIRGDWSVRMPGFEPFLAQDAVLFGPTDRHGAIGTTGGKTVGFGLTPIGWHRLIGGDASCMANRVVRLEDQLGGDGLALRQALIADGDDDGASVARLETMLLARLATRPPVGAQVIAADRALRSRPAEVPDFAAAAGMAERSLYRLCLRTYGFAPKRLMRLQRFLDTLGQVRTAVGDAVGASLSESYFDQAHFYRDFHDFMAMTPRAYFSAPRPLMAAAAAAQTAAGVTLSFRLPDPPDDAGPAASPAAPVRAATSPRETTW